MKKVAAPQVVRAGEAAEMPLPAQIQDALGELVGAAREGLLALSVGGVGVVARHYLSSHQGARQLAAAATGHGYITAFWWAAGIFAVGLFLTLIGSRHPRASGPSPLAATDPGQRCTDTSRPRAPCRPRSGPAGATPASDGHPRSSTRSHGGAEKRSVPGSRCP
jgi:hypothetical protein